MKKGWSFCIITAPGNKKTLLSCIESISSEFCNTGNYEIIVIGGENLGAKFNEELIRFVDFNEEFFSLRLSNIRRFLKEKSLKRLFLRTGAICHKKNLAAKLAKYDKLCVMHDYVSLEKGWRAGFEKFGETWQVSMNVILNKDGSRHRDWMIWDHPLIKNKNSQACLLPYNEFSRYMYISGTYFCVKKNFFLDNPLDEMLFWGEAEDVEWSLRVRDKTKFRMNTSSKVKYLKLKSLDDAPYCKSWIDNEKELLELIKSGHFF